MYHSFKQDAFLNKLEIIVRKESSIEISVDEGWYSEGEMTSELKWSKLHSQPCVVNSDMLLTIREPCLRYEKRLLLPSKALRSRVAGAVELCKKTPETHCRSLF